MNTIDNNRLIAEFEGHKINFGFKKDGVLFLGEHIGLDKLKYHTSWDWLMPVVEKIESDERYDVEILQYGTRITDNQKEIVNNIANISFDKKINHTYDAVIEFIKQHK